MILDLYKLPDLSLKIGTEGYLSVEGCQKRKVFSVFIEFFYRGDVKFICK